MYPQSYKHIIMKCLGDLGGFFNRYPLENSAGLKKSPLFIIGSGRSGNTLLRAMLVASGEFAIPPESYVLGRLIFEYRFFNFLSWDALVSIVFHRFETHREFRHWNIDLSRLFRKATQIDYSERSLAKLIDSIYRHYGESNVGRTRFWGDKTPLNTYYLDEIDSVFPNARFIHLIRDGRDVVGSFKASGLITDLRKAARTWKTMFLLAYEFGKQIESSRYMEVKYENLVSNPEKTLTSICNYLNIQYRDSMLKHYEIAEDLGDTVLSHHSRVHQPVNTDSIGKWKFRLSQEDQRLVHDWLHPVLSALSYV